MHIITVGLSHKTAPVEIREKLSFPEKLQEDALRMLLKNKHISEAVILSTCNRTEIYSVVTESEAGKMEIVKFLYSFQDFKKNELDDYLYFRYDSDAIYHLFCVTASIDSMIVGEAQILGQVKEAYQYAYDAGVTRLIFNRMFRHGIGVGKKVRTDTDIGESAVSISYAAVQLAKSVFEELVGRTIMIIGAGEMSELTAKHLLSSGDNKVLVANRTFRKGKEIADKFGGKAIKFDEIIDYLAKTDIVISSTSASGYILNKEEMAEVMHKRRNKPIFLIDIAVPRDINPEVEKLYNVFLYDVDDLESVVQANIQERIQEAEKAKVIIEREVEDFSSWISSLEVVPTIKALRQKVENIKEKELEKHLAKLQHLEEKDKEVIKSIAAGIINKVLHEPTIKLRECVEDKDGYLYIESLRHLFSLSEKEEGE
ncbi:MAG: glutamyl-tRNA reductase [Actinomycetia bacterium]|nr:glutamyl-tRNA reductase [Actinomycetes bacterium]